MNRRPLPALALAALALAACNPPGLLSEEAQPGGVNPPPARLSATLVSFQAPVYGDPAAQTVLASSADGRATLQPSFSISYQNGDAWLSVSVSPTASPDTWAVTLRPTPAGQAFGTLYGSVTIVLPGHAPTDVSVDFGVREWRLTSPVRMPRRGHTATLLGDGRVLVTGGVSDASYPRSSPRCEIYDPATDTWTEAAPLAEARQRHTATLLGDGRVLIAGGTDIDPGGEHPVSSLELFDPLTGSFAPAAALRSPTMGAHAAALLADGRVLLTDGASAEIFDPALGTTTAAAAPGERRSGAGAVALSSGKVLWAGGTDGTLLFPVASLLFDPAAGTWAPAGDMVGGRADFALVALPGGRALAAGGLDGRYLWTAEVFEEGTGRWSPAPDLIGGHSGPGTLLPSGRALVTPSQGWPAEVFDPAAGTWADAGQGFWNRHEPTATALPDGRVLLVGTDGDSPRPTGAELLVVAP